MNFEQILSEFENEHLKTLKEIKSKSQIKNSNPLTNNSWTSKVVNKVKISELAFEFGVDKCPVCSYGINFDDSRGWFICINAKYNRACDFKGNIVNFMERFG